jgi:hypothetical protein
MRDLLIDTRLLIETVHELDADVACDINDLEAAFSSLVLLEEAVRDLASVKRVLENKLGALMTDSWYLVMGLGTFERTSYRPGRHRCVDEGALWCAVLNSRYVTADGEILSQLDRVVRAYGSESRATGRVRLTGASPMKIEPLGLDPDHFFDAMPRAGWKVRLIR